MISRGIWNEGRAEGNDWDGWSQFHLPPELETIIRHVHGGPETRFVIKCLQSRLLSAEGTHPTSEQLKLSDPYVLTVLYMSLAKD